MASNATDEHLEERQDHRREQARREPRAGVPVPRSLVHMRVEASVLEDLEDAARRRPGVGSAHGVARDGDLDHREVGCRDELRERRDQEYPEDRERRPDDEAGRHRSDRVGRLAGGPAHHDQVAQDQPAQGDERDREDEHPTIEVGDGRVGHRIERRKEVALEVVEIRSARVADHVRVPNREVVDWIADERDVALARSARQRRGCGRWGLGCRRRVGEMAREPEGETDQAKGERDECGARQWTWLEALDRDQVCSARLEAEGRSHEEVARYGWLIRPYATASAVIVPTMTEAANIQTRPWIPFSIRFWARCSASAFEPASVFSMPPQTMTAPESATPRPMVIATSAPIMFSTGASAFCAAGGTESAASAG